MLIDMSDSDVLAPEESTPGLALVAAEMYLRNDIDGLRDICQHLDPVMYYASSLQLSTTIIDQVAILSVSNQIFDAYQKDDFQTLEEIKSKGFDYDTEGGVLNVWRTNETQQPEFPLEYWTTAKFGIEAGAVEASQELGIELEIFRKIYTDYLNDGVIPLLVGENRVSVPHPDKYLPNHKDNLSFYMVAVISYINSLLLSTAVKDNNRSEHEELHLTIEYFTENVRESIRQAML